MLPCEPDNKNQYHLYSTWSTFTYKRVGRQERSQYQSPLVGKKRTMRCNDISNGTKYLLINHHSSGWDNFLCCTNYCHCIVSGAYALATTATATPTGLYYYECFAHELLRFILGDGGKRFTLPPKLWSRNWDRVMEDLLTNVAQLASAFTRRATQGISSTRGSELNFFGIDNLDARSCLHSCGMTTGDNGDQPPRNDDYFPDDGELRGISILEFVVSHEEGQRE